MNKCYVCQREFKNFGFYYERHIEKCEKRMEKFIQKAIERFNSNAKEFINLDCFYFSIKSDFLDIDDLEVKDLLVVSKYINSKLSLIDYYKKYTIFIELKIKNFPISLKGVK